MGDGSQSQNMLDVGELMIPTLLTEQLEVYVDSEKLHSNLKPTLLSGLFENLPPYDDPNAEQQMMSMATDLNVNECQWKHLGKSITDYIKTEELDKDSKPLSELSIDEITEFAVYDSQSRQTRREALAKKLRRVYAGSAITVKVLFKNELGMSMHLQNIRVLCKYADGGQDYTQSPMSVVVTPSQTIEVFLKVTPQRCGELFVERIQWELFDVVRCSKEIDG